MRSFPGVRLDPRWSQVALADPWCHDTHDDASSLPKSWLSHDIVTSSKVDQQCCTFGTVDSATVRALAIRCFCRGLPIAQRRSTGHGITSNVGSLVSADGPGSPGSAHRPKSTLAIGQGQPAFSAG